MAILALEISTSSAKAVIFEPSTAQITQVVGHPYPSSISDTSTMDSPGIVDEIFSLGKELLNGRTDIDMIVLSSIWYHSGGIFDKDVKPIGRLRTWADTSGSKIVNEYRKSPELYDRMYKLTGNPPHSIYALYKWLELAENNNMKISDVPYLMALPDYLFYRFTGKRMVSSQTASASGLMNIHKLNWDSQIMDMNGISNAQLSEITEPEHTEPLSADAAALLGLPSGIPVLIPGADGACNQIAVGGLRPGIMSVSVGTSAALRLSTDKPLIADGDQKNWCYYGAENRWISGAATNGAGCCLDWFAKKLCCGTSLRELDAELAPLYKGPMDAPIFLPFQFGERCPGWPGSRQGGWQDMTGSDNRTTLYYSVLEGVLFNMYQCYRMLCRDGEPEHIQLSGGIVRSSVWLQMAADIFHCPMELTSVEHASILGALRIAQKVLGYTENLRDVKCEVTRTVFPQSDVDFSPRFNRYCEWYERTK